MNDAVSYQGSAYIALAANTNEEPGNGSSWDLLASKGDQGPAGSGGGGGGSFPDTYTVVVSGEGTRQSSDLDPGKFVWVLVAECQPGDKVLGGGYREKVSLRSDVDLVESYPSVPLGGGIQGWIVAVSNSNNHTWWAWALCADVTP